MSKPAYIFIACAIILLGGIMRFAHLDWDGFNNLHPDERGIIFRLEAVSEGNLNPLRDSAGEPTKYAYGHFHLYLAWGIDRIVETFTPGFNPFDRMTISLRLLSAWLDALTVLVVLLTAKQALEKKAALFAASLTAGTVLLIQNAHYGTVDSGLTFFTMLSLFFIIRAIDSEESLWFIASSIAAGIAMGFKNTGAFLLIPLLWLFTHSDLVREMRINGTLTLSAVMGLTYALTNPYIILDLPTYLDASSIQTSMVYGFTDWPFTYQYRGTIPFITQLRDQAFWGMGVPLTIAAYTGLILAIIHTWKKQLPDTLKPVLLWVAILMLLFGPAFMKFPRYLLPAIPPLILLGVYGITQIQSKPYRVSVKIIVLISTIVWACIFLIGYRDDHPWITASRWMHENIPSGSLIAAESYGDGLPLLIYDDGLVLISPDSYEYHSMRTLLDSDEDAYQAALDALAASDYLVIPDSRVINGLNGSEDYPQMAAFYAALTSGSLGYVPIAAFERPLPFPGSLIPGAWIDESLTLYERPVVTIYQNHGGLTPVEIGDLINMYR